MGLNRYSVLKNIGGDVLTTELNSAQVLVQNGLQQRANTDIRYIPQFSFEKGKTPKQSARNVKSIHDTDTAKVNQEFWYHRFGSGNFEVKDVSRCCRSTVENVAETIENL